MPTSALGNRRANRRTNRRAPNTLPSSRGRRRAGGFSLIELMVVFAIIALGVGMVVLALPDGDESKLEEEGVRLSALFEMARAEARVAGVAVRWVPKGDNLPGPSGASPGQFAFSGLPGKVALPNRWLDSRTQAQVVGATFLVLGPDAILPAQRVMLSLGNRRLELASDGLSPFAPSNSAATPAVAMAGPAIQQAQPLP